MHPSDINVQILSASDFDGTEFREDGGPFDGLDDLHPIVQAHHPATGLVCALALGEDRRGKPQRLDLCEFEARYKLAGYIARHRNDLLVDDGDTV